MGGSSKGSSTTTVKRLPAYAEPYAKSYLEGAETLSLEAYTNYPENTYADQTADEIAAIAKLVARGSGGNALIDKSIVYLEAVLDGDYLLGVYSKFTDLLSTISSKTTAQFSTINDLLGGKPYIIGDLSNDNLAQEMSSTTAATVLARNEKILYNKNYLEERLLQNDSIEYVIEHGKQSIVDGELLRMAGVLQREYDHGYYMDLYKEWYEDQIGDIKRLEILGNGVRALVGTQTSITKPYYRPSKIAGAIGGALSFAVMGQKMMSSMAASKAVAGGATIAEGAKIGSSAGWYGVAAGVVIGGIMGLMQ
jgi:hypothetical protein